MRMEIRSFELSAPGKGYRPRAGANSSGQRLHPKWAKSDFIRRNNAKAQTWKKQSGSFGDRPRLHGNELRLRPRRGQTTRDFCDPCGRIEERDATFYGRDLRSLHK